MVDFSAQHKIYRSQPLPVHDQLSSIWTPLLEALNGEGVPIDPHREDSDYRRFPWIMDPEGNRIELWEPPNK